MSDVDLVTTVLNLRGTVDEQYGAIVGLEKQVKELTARLNDYVRMFSHLQTVALRLTANDETYQRDWWNFLVLLTKPELIEEVQKIAATQLSRPKFEDKGV